MKTKLLLFALLTHLGLQAKFVKASILFNDGHIENGLVDSFLENKFIDFRLFKTMEQELNLDDKKIKFKIDENSEAKSISINDVDEMTLTYKNDYIEQYKVLNMKTISPNGEIVDKHTKLWFRLVKKGKINIYGYRYMAIDNTPISRSASIEYEIYYQNENDDYVVNPYENLDFFNFGGVKRITLTFLRNLFKDCPEFVAKMDAQFEETPSNDAMKEYRSKRKEKEQKFAHLKKTNSILHYYETTSFGFADKIEEYESECP